MFAFARTLPPPSYVRTFLFFILAPLALIAVPPAFGQPAPAVDDLAARVEAVEQDVIAWRRDFHQHPELSNREFRTAEEVAAHLRSLDMDVQTGVAHTGVVGVLRGGRPGPVVGLRADMDALPVTERTGLPFASTVRATYGGLEVGVMHACGHDAHVAILMGVAQVLASMRDELPGTVKFIFQPAEEGAPAGEEGGAKLMVEQGVLENPDVDAVIGLHVDAQRPAGTIGYRAGGIMASADDFRIRVRGRQSHGARPWAGVDPIVVSAQIVNSLQTIVSRQLPITQSAAVVTVGKLTAGVRSNIIPEEAEMIGTVRALDPAVRDSILVKLRRQATLVAESMGAVATVEIPLTMSYPVTYNDPALLERMLPSLRRAAGEENVQLTTPETGAEDFSFYALKVPSLFFRLGGMPPDQRPEEAPAHHTPDFYLDESGFQLGVRALTQLAVDYLRAGPQ